MSSSDPVGPNIGPIGAEPTGATPIDDDDLVGLIPDFVATRADLNRVEFESITRALPRLIAQARNGGPHTVLDYGFVIELHRQMFSDVWHWAGTLRRRQTNIGAAPALIAPRTMQCIDNARYWHDQNTYPTEELAIRLHAQLVAVHPFPNGNGRCTRLAADLYLTSVSVPMFTWGAASLDTEGTPRQRYLTALIHALETGDHTDLVDFARS